MMTAYTNLQLTKVILLTLSPFVSFVVLCVLCAPKLFEWLRFVRQKISSILPSIVRFLEHKEYKGTQRTQR